MAQQDPFLESLLKLEKWSSNANYKAFDTFDGLSSPFSFLTFNVPLLKQVWQQGVRRFPANIRPLLLIKPAHSSKGMGFFAQGYLRLFQITGKDEYRQKMDSCLDWLVKNRCPEFKGNAWGNHFDYQSRSGQIPPGTPTIVWTSLIAHAFMDAYDAFGEEKYLNAAHAAAEFITNELGWIDTGKDICLSYIPLPGGKPVKGPGTIHNSNVLGAGLLARVNTHRPNPRYLELAKPAVAFTVRDQLPNGAWWYGVMPKNHWVDSFHTAYNLESIDWYQRCSGDRDFDQSLKKGYKFWIDTFFGEDGTPRYYDYKTPPLDIQCASQGIQTLVNLRNMDPRSAETAERVARWTIRHMQDASGYFYYRKYPLVTNKTPTLHWGQATMFAALAVLIKYRASVGTRENAATLAA